MLRDLRKGEFVKSGPLDTPNVEHYRFNACDQR